MLTSLLHGLLSLRGWPAYLITAALCFGEAAFFLGFVIPGEIAVIYGGVLASEHHVSLLLMCVVVVAAAVLGDVSGYLVGRFLGPHLLSHRPLRDNSNVDKTRAFVRRRGGPAVFLGRFVSIFRALVPGIAGASELGFPTFLLFNALGAILWGIAFTLVGYVAGKSYESALRVIGNATFVIIGVIVILLATLVVLRWRRRRRAPARGESKAD